ncbi:MAG: DUF4190 domain-containing protein [Clostridia bacterium]|nr:DUF4190 domain-containing protein [Clostridia bacterium]
MYCKYCGTKLSDDNAIKFCPNCGSKLIEAEPAIQQPQQNVQPKQENPAQTLSILGLIFSFVFSLVGLILSAIALKRYKEQTNQDGKGMAIAGLVVSIVTVAIYALYFLIFIIALATA